MSRKLWLSTVTVAVALLAVFAGSAAAGHARSGATGGTLNVDLPNDVDYTDPALDYLSTGWEIEYATCLKLMNYPDANGAKGSQLIPEAAAGFPKVSNNGKTYDFNVKAGFTKFSNGQPVTAANFKAASTAIADPKMQSPAVPFFSDIVGSSQVARLGRQGQGLAPRHQADEGVPGLPRPDGDAVLLRDPEEPAHDPNGVLAPASAGPYYISSRVPNKSIVVKRNPYYKGKRPHNLNQIVYNVGNSLPATYLRAQQGATDYAAGGIPPASYAEAANKYGVNKSQFWVKPQLGISYLAFNHDRSLFKGARARTSPRRSTTRSTARRCSRRVVTSRASGPTRSCLPASPASVTRTCTRSRGRTSRPPRSGRPRPASRAASRSSTTPRNRLGPLVAQILQFNLKQIGLTVNSHLFARAVQIEKEGTRGEPFDITSEAWIADYADPYDFINVLLSGDNLHASNNNNVAYFNSATYNKQMRNAALLSGAGRYKAYGNLDVSMMHNDPPWAARSNFNARVLVSKRVGCFTFNPIYSVDLSAICLK